MTDTPATATFIVHFDRCDPSKWRPADVLQLADYIRTGSLSHAAALSRLGVQLVLDERHEPKGGVLERIGVAEPDSLNEFAETIDELDIDEDVFEIVPIYRGPVEYVARLGTGDDEGNFEGYEYDTFETEAEAQALVKSAHDHAEKHND